MKKVLSILVFVVFAICLLTACNNVEVSLAFDANGGTFENGENIIVVTTDGVSKVSVPKNPSKDGYEFKGWFWDNETFNKPFTANSLLDEPIQSDMTVYVKWEETRQTEQIDEYLISANDFEIEGNHLYLEVSNSTESFSFINKLDFVSGISFIVARDISGTDIIV